MQASRLMGPLLGRSADREGSVCYSTGSTDPLRHFLTLVVVYYAGFWAKFP